MVLAYCGQAFFSLLWQKAALWEYGIGRIPNMSGNLSAASTKSFRCLQPRSCREASQLQRFIMAGPYPCVSACTSNQNSGRDLSNQVRLDSHRSLHWRLAAAAIVIKVRTAYISTITYDRFNIVDGATPSGGNMRGELAIFVPAVS